MARLRIGIDAHVITGKFQGTRTTLTSLLQALARRDPEHDIVVYSDDPAAAAEAIGPSRFEYRPLGHVGPIKRLLRLFPRLLREDAINVGVFQYNTPLFGKSRRVVFIHDILPMTHPSYFPLANRLRIRLFFSISILRSALVVAVSDYTRQIVQSRFRLPDDRIVTVTNGPSFAPEAYSQARSESGERYILAVGRIEQRKNIKLLVDAFLKSRPAGVKLIVVGSRDLGYDYSLPDDPMIEHRQGISDEILKDLYRGASLFVYPSAAEGFGMPLLDALLFGLPVIAANNTALPEVGGSLATYFDCNADNAQDVLASLIAAHFADGPIKAPSAEERAALAQRFNWDDSATRLLAAIDSLRIVPQGLPTT